MTVDVSAFVGAYPFRTLPNVSPAFLLREMDRVGIDEAWVGYLPSFLTSDPMAGTQDLLRMLDGRLDRLRPVPAIHPDLPKWQLDLEFAVGFGAPAVRAYPMHLRIDPSGGAMQALAAAAGGRGLPVVLTVRFEDVRQRHPLDVAPDLPAAAVRTLARVDPAVRLIVTHAGREFIEEVHFGLTPDEAQRVLWDVSWLWGPPACELTALVEHVGAQHFVFGSGMPLRIADATVAKLDLADLTPGQRAAIEEENLLRWVRG